jgi:hypothetical protein
MKSKLLLRPVDLKSAIEQQKSRFLGPDRHRELGGHNLVITSEVYGD